MVLLVTVLSLILSWLYHNLYDYFAFFCGMYVTVTAMHEAIELIDGVDMSMDTEEIFEECMDELYVVAPLAEPEYFGEF